MHWEDLEGSGGEGGGRGDRDGEHIKKKKERKKGPFLSHPFHREGKLRHQGQQASPLGMVSQGAIQIGANEPPGS